jgi:hypothetical protein
VNRVIVILGVAAVAACGAGGGTEARVTVDTLPGGVVRTMSSSPVDSGRWSLVLDHVV